MCIYHCAVYTVIVLFGCPNRVSLKEMEKQYLLNNHNRMMKIATNRLAPRPAPIFEVNNIEMYANKINKTHLMHVD